jgi:signal transduction histidine kinase
MRTLRSRLLAGYAVLVLLTVMLASGASLVLFDLQGRNRGQSEMAQLAEQLARRIAIAISEDPSGDASAVLTEVVRQAPFGRPLLAQVLLVDRTGDVVAAPRRTPIVFQTTRFKPVLIGNAVRPHVGLARLADGVRVAYVAARITDLPADMPERWLIVARPSREIHGLWRTMLPSSAVVGTIALLLAGLVSWQLARGITRPVEAMTAASARLAAGDYSARVPEGTGQDEVARLARAFNRMAADVGDAHRRQREFVANVGHDLRTPLTTVRGFAEALLDGTARTDVQREQALTTISTSAGRMADLVEELLVLARLEGQEGGLELAAVAVTDLVDGAVAANAGTARARNVAVHVDVRGGDDRPLAVRADGAWLSRALSNVLDNALRYAPRGSTVRISAARESAAHTEPAARRVAISITDAGPGMPPEVAARAFERFFRADPSRAAGNSGLGLAIAREIVEAHGGSIAIETSVGHGTCVTLRLPPASL